jgi:hypothetical protein
LSATQKGNGLISRAVREALSTLVSPPICEQLISRSLKAQGLTEVPEYGREVASWLEGPLRAAVDEVVGTDAADLVLAQLAPMAAYAAILQPQAEARGTKQHATVARSATPTPSRGNAALLARGGSSEPGGLNTPDRPTAIHFAADSETDWDVESLRPLAGFDRVPDTGVFHGVERITMMSEPDNANELLSRAKRTLPPPEKPSSPPREVTRPQNLARLREELASLPRVLAATTDSHQLDALRHYLAGTANVVHIRDLAGLLDALEEQNSHHPIVLVDCSHPSVHIGSVAAIREDLPRGSTVVVWGADENTWLDLERDKQPGCRWVRCSREATTDDVGSLCSMLLG